MPEAMDLRKDAEDLRLQRLAVMPKTIKPKEQSAREYEQEFLSNRIDED